MNSSGPRDSFTGFLPPPEILLQRSGASEHRVLKGTFRPEGQEAAEGCKYSTVRSPTLRIFRKYYWDVEI
jgi:hypothetical protein